MPFVRPAWAQTWRLKSATRLAARSVSLRQGCPSRGGIRRKPAANPLLDEQKSHTRPLCAGEFAKQNEAQPLPGAHGGK